MLVAKGRLWPRRGRSGSAGIGCDVEHFMYFQFETDRDTQHSSLLIRSGAHGNVALNMVATIKLATRFEVELALRQRAYQWASLKGLGSFHPFSVHLQVRAVLWALPVPVVQQFGKLFEDAVH